MLLKLSMYVRVVWIHEPIENWRSLFYETAYVSKFIQLNFNNQLCFNLNNSKYSRKIVYVNGMKERVIKKIYKYLDETNKTSTSIIQSVSEMKEIVERVEQRSAQSLIQVEKIEQRVMKLENYFEFVGKYIELSLNGKNSFKRILKRENDNLFVSIGRNKHMLNLNELNKAKFY